MLLVTCILPQILLLGDRLISKTSFSAHRGTIFSHAGVVHLDGHIRGYVNGYIDAEIHGKVNGEINAHMEIDNLKDGQTPAEPAPQEKEAQGHEE